MEEDTDLNLDANLRSSSLVLLRMSIFTLSCYAVVLVIDDLMCLNFLEGVLTTFFRHHCETSGDFARSMVYS